MNDGFLMDCFLKKRNKTIYLYGIQRYEKSLPVLKECGD
jgi:hypothetical protein